MLRNFCAVMSLANLMTFTGLPLESMIGL
jgi:hypothetical protein